MAELKTLFVVSIVTARVFFPGLPTSDTSSPFASASKMLNLDVHSTMPSDAKSSATCTLPQGLMLGESVELTVRPNPETTGTPNGAASGTRPGDIPKPTVKTYWGCSEEVIEGQPDTGCDVDALGSRTTVSSHLDFDPVSYAFLPPASGRIDTEASAAGTYALSTNYCGNASVTVASDQDFLLPVEVVGTSRQSDLEKPIKVEWKPVPNAVAYILQAFGGKLGESVVWSSSAKPVTATDLERNPISKEDLEKLVGDGILLPGSSTSCAIPAGIFKGSDSVMLSITAFGRDTIQVQSGTAVHVVVRSTTSTPLYSKPYVPPTGSEGPPPSTIEPPPAP